MRAVRDITNQQIEKQQKATILKELIELLDERRLNEAEKKEITKLSINYILNMSVGEFRDVYFVSNNTVAFNEKEISFKNLIIKLSKLYNNTKNTYSALLNPNIFHALLRERIQTTKVSALLPEDSIQIHELESLTTSEVLNKINEIKHRPLLEEETKAREFISEKELEDRQVLLDMARGKSISIQHSKSERELFELMETFGAPAILQSDNGKEFRNSVVEALKLLWSGLKIIHGRPRHPQSQESVERSNGDIQNGCEKIKVQIGQLLFRLFKVKKIEKIIRTKD
jgi:hypothetical protein